MRNPVHPKFILTLLTGIAALFIGSLASAMSEASMEINSHRFAPAERSYLRQQAQQSQPGGEPLVPVGGGFTYQGRLKDGPNSANGRYDFTFRLFDSPTGGAQVGSTIPRLNQSVSEGLVTIDLDFGTGAFQGQARYLEVMVRQAGGGTFTTLSPRQVVSPAPYATSLRPGVMLTGTNTLVQLISGVNFAGVYALGVDDMGVWGQSTHNVGVRGQSANDTGVRGISANGMGVHGSTTGGGTGVYGESVDGIGAHGSSSTDIGVLGESNSARGVYGRSTGSIGVHGESTSNTGVFGQSATGMGVYGLSDNLVGVLGESESGTGVRGNTVDGFGVYGSSTAGVGVRGESTQFIGVYGVSNQVGVQGEGVITGVRGEGTVTGVYGEGSVWAGDFHGNVRVSGSCCGAGAGTSRIDHPLDPTNQYLSHAFVESPDMMNVYNGNVTTGANGEAVVTLPDYIEALNTDYRYQLTVVGQFAQAAVWKKIEGNRFTIKTDKPNVEVSWQVTGIRKDAYAEAHPIVVEEDKGEDRGKYLHPIEHGQPESTGIDYEERQMTKSQP